MMHRMRLALLLGVVFCALCSMAAAQYESSDKSVIGIGYSIMKPSGGQLKQIKGTWPGPTLDVHFKFDELDRPQGIVTIGWFGESGPNGSKATFVPIKVAYLKRYGQKVGRGYYLGGALNAYFADYKGIEYSPFTRDYTFVSQKGIPLGMGLIAGIEFGGAYFGEMRYDIMRGLALPTGNSVDFGGMSFSLGCRFAF